VQDLRSFASEREGFAEAFAANRATDSDTVRSPLRAPHGARHREP